MAIGQNTKGNRGAVSGKITNSIFQKEMGRAREEEWAVGDAADPQAA